MKLKKVNQFHSGTATGDAITGDMLEMQRVLRQAGWESEIYAEHIAPDLRGKILPIGNYEGDPEALLIVHHSLGFGVFEKIAALADRKILRYHNITPPEFMDANRGVYSTQGRDQLRQYVPYMELAVGDSEYNRSELIHEGYRYTSSIPIFFQPETLVSEAVDPGLAAKLAGTFNLLFVGRIASNKKQGDLVEILYRYRRNYDGNARLVLVGGGGGAESYADKVRAMVRDRGLGEAVLLTGKVSLPELCAAYRASNVLVCASEHEGFCVPLLEAMAFDLPVIAFSAAAVPETLGGSGILLDTKNPELWCETIHELRRDDQFRKSVLQSQRERLDQLSPERSGMKLLDIIRGLAGAQHKLSDQRPTLQIQGPFETSYSLAAVNRDLALALDHEGTFDVSIYCMEGPGDYVPEEKHLADKPRARWLWQKSKWLNGRPDVVIRNLYPPRVTDVQGIANFLYFFWEDSLISKDWADNFNRHLDGVLAPSQHIRNVLKNSGVEIPLPLVHVGVEERFFHTADAHRENRIDGKFRFLHVSSGFPRKGIDTLLESYFTEFKRTDDVCLVVKTFPNIHNDVAGRISDWRTRTPEAPEVVHIDEDLGDDKLDSLYRRADCMVYPTRCEGFGLPIAEAMARKIPVIVTAYSGHMDFCSEENAFLVGYKLVNSESHLNVRGAQWAEPDVSELRRQMRFVVENRRSAVVKRKCDSAYELMASEFRWPVTACTCVREIAEVLKKKEASIRKLAMVTSWDSRCGIAEYSRYLIEAVKYKRPGLQIEVLSSPGEGVWQGNSISNTVCWRQERNSNLAQMRNCVLDHGFDIVHFQFNFGFFDLSELARTISEFKAAGVVVLVTLHSTADASVNGEKVSLAQVSGPLKLADALLVHSQEDAAHLAKFAIRENVHVIPHGNVIFPPEAKELRQTWGIEHRPLIGTFGFLLAHKGMLELLEAVKRLQVQYPEVGLAAQCALHHSGLSNAFELTVRHKIEELGIASRVLLSTEFVEAAEAVMLLQLCDVIVLPYRSTKESSSAAVRFALAAGRPVITTSQPIFTDVADATYQIGSGNSEEIAAAVQEVLENPRLYDSLSNKAREYVDCRSWNTVAEQYLGILDEILRCSRVVPGL